MIQREAEAQITAWKEESAKKCLMIRGARQVGKTYLVDHYGAHHYGSYIRVNFLETPGLKQVFSGNLDADTIRMNLSAYLPQSKFLDGDTLLFLDEIQECAEAITSLKFLAQDKRFDVIASGSMLGLDVNRPTSYPVGSVQYLEMTSLSFREFLRSAGIAQEVLDVLRACFDACGKVPEGIHRRLQELLRTYLMIGGMPEVVTDYLAEGSLVKADERQRTILRDYRYDIAHYAPADVKLKAENCYFSLPGQLSKENHKFQYKIVEKGSNARKYATALDGLTGACLVRKVHNVRKTSVPLQAYMEETHFRLYPTDIGLLTGMFPYETKTMLREDQGEKTLGETKGGLYEALVADMLFKNGHETLYFRKNEQATFEIEFLMETKDGIVPVEVKASNTRSKSLDRMLEHADIPYGYKLTGGNMGRSGKKITMPLYMAMFL